MKDPHIVKFKDLILEEQRLVAWMEKNYPAMVLSGEIHSYTAQRRLACHKAILRLLKKHHKDPQLNLDDAMQAIKQPGPSKLIPPPIPVPQYSDDPNFFTTLD